jgi:sortase (surface protein transpeptidase)
MPRSKQQKENVDILVMPYEERISAKRHYIRVVAFVGGGICLGVLLMLHAYPYLSMRSVSPIAVIGVQSPTATMSYGFDRALPTHIRIPSILVDTTFAPPLGLNTDQTISIPESFDQVAWYKLGASPGEVGTAAILGHVDSHDGPAVFYALGQVIPGDSIFITRADGTDIEFVVEYFERYMQDSFPTEKVYAPTVYPSLRLITCSGIFDRGAQRYSHNLVVYARLKVAFKSN